VRTPFPDMIRPDEGMLRNAFSSLSLFSFPVGRG